MFGEISYRNAFIYFFVGFLFYKLIKFMFYKPPNFPPGPPRIPIFGSYLFLLILDYNFFHRSVDILCKYYNTKILGFYYNQNIPMIAINDADAVKEALHHPDFIGRPQSNLAKSREPNFSIRGLFYTEGDLWKNQKRFFMTHLKEQGFGKRFQELEIEINEEILNLIDLIKNGPKYSFERDLNKIGNIRCPHIFFPCVANIFLKILTNERYSRNDYGELLEVTKEVLTFQRNGDLWGRIYSVVKQLAFIMPEWSGYRTVRTCSMNIYDFMKKICDQHIETYEPGHIRNILDSYIKEIKEAEDKNESSSFISDQLVMTCVDLFFPASSATPISLGFMLRRCILQPDVQKRIQQEIDDVVGHGRLPTLDDRLNLPYTEAAIREMIRHESLVPPGLARRAIRDTVFRGYNIPKGTSIMPFLISINHDPNKFDDPLEYRPERFLNGNGKLDVKKDVTMTFGGGARVCVGEIFIRNMIFLLTSAVLQNFHVRAADPKYPSIPMKTNPGLLYNLPDFRVKLEPR